MDLEALLPTLLDQTWYHRPPLGWVVLDREDYRNAPESEQRCLIHCEDWTEHSIPRSDMSKLVLWRQRIRSIQSEGERAQSIALLQGLRSEFAARRSRFAAARAEKQRLWAEELRLAALALEQETRRSNEKAIALFESSLPPTFADLQAACGEESIAYCLLLRTAEWHSRRAQIHARERFKCKECGYTGSLETHHLKYVVNWLPWDYPDDALVTLCGECHGQLNECGKSPVYELINGKLVQRPLRPCRRCRGVGWFPQWSHIEGGICFRCRGKRFEASTTPG